MSQVRHDTAIGQPEEAYGELFCVYLSVAPTVWTHDRLRLMSTCDDDHGSFGDLVTNLEFYRINHLNISGCLFVEDRFLPTMLFCGLTGKHQTWWYSVEASSVPAGSS